MAITQSILDTIKAMLGIPSVDTAFDTDIIVNINSTFMVLNQLGIGPASVFSIEDKDTLWTAFLTDPTVYSAVKTYIYLKVKQTFDPPSSSYVVESIKNQIVELEFRLMVKADPPIPPDPIVEE